MLNVMRLRLLKITAGREPGQTLVEYGLIVSLIALVAVAGLTTLGGGTGGIYDTIEAAAEALVSTL